MTCIKGVLKHGDKYACIDIYEEGSGWKTGSVCGAGMKEASVKMLELVSRPETCARELVSGMNSASEIIELCFAPKADGSMGHHSLERACRNSGWQR